jgi:hypothetical protein
VSDVLRLDVPARAELLPIVRLGVGGAAALIEASVTELEDLQLATEELCLTLLPSDAVAGERLSLEVEWDEASVLVRCIVASTLHERRRAEDADDALPAGVVDRILDALVEEHGTSVDGDYVVAWLRMRRGRDRPSA